MRWGEGKERGDGGLGRGLDRGLLDSFLVTEFYLHRNMQTVVMCIYMSMKCSLRSLFHHEAI